MRTRFFKSILLALALMAALPASAYDFMVDGLCYDRNSDGTSVTVTYERTSSPRYTSLNGAITIPETVTYSGTTYSVTSIGGYAFYGCGGLTSVTIPNSVTSIGSSAFYGTGIYNNHPNGVFYVDKWVCDYKGDEPSGNLILQSDSRGIANSAFSGCSGLTSVTIPNSVASIGDYAFLDCRGLTSIVVESSNPNYDSRNDCNAIIETASNTLITGCVNTVIPTSVTAIGDYAFYGCTGLTSVTIPNSVTSIGDEAFYGCSGLTSVTIPGSVTSIGENAFWDCIGLTSVTIPNSVTSIGFCAFDNCSGLTSINSKILNPNNVTLGDNVFVGVDKSSCILTVPVVSLNLYKAAAQWKDFLNIFPDVMVSSISLNKTQLILDKGQTETLTATVLPANAYSVLNWSSSNTSVATVDQNGKVTAKTAGNATITASATDGSGVKATCQVTVIIPVASITLSQTSATINKGNSLTLTATVQPTNATNKTLSWSSSNTSVATVDQNGKVTAKAAGNATITATATDGSDVSASCQVSVIIPVSSITLSQTSATINKGNSLTLTATIQPTNATNKTLSWSSSNTSVATVDQNGKVTAKAAGNATITATATDGSGVKATCQVTVVIPVTSITLSQTSATINKGNSLTLTATIQPTNATNKTLSWSSSNMSVATVDQNGKVTAKAVGSATITATATDGSDVSASCQVSVIIPVSSITLTQTSATINKGNSLTLTATILPTNATNKTLSWSSSNTNVATVDQNGKVTAKAAGGALITASATDGSGVNASCRVTVNAPVSSITLSQTSANIYQSGTLTLTATVLPSDASNKTLTWSSSNTNVATVDQNGKITAKQVGTATITATATDGTNQKATCVVTVKGITNITLNKTATSLLVGDNETLTATFTPSGVINKTLTWSSSNTSVATVGPYGTVTAKALGTATITATATDGSGVSASCLVTVVPDYSLTITPDVAHVRGTEQRTYELAINMSNRQAISGLQFVMKLPTGVSLVTDSYGDYDIWLDNDRKARNHTWGVEPRANNSYFVLISSPTNRTFSGNTGAVLHLTVQIDKFHSSIGDYAITLSDVVMAEADETQHTAPSAQSTVRLAYLVGDANADVEVDVADYVVTANYLLGRDTGTHFFTDAANAAYDNSTVNVTDLVAITNIALELREKEIKPGVEGYQLAPAVMPPGADYAVTAAVTEASADRTVVTVAVDNDAPLAALQLDLDLPQGVTLERAAVTERATGMDAATGTTPEGKARVILSSFGTQEIAGGGGDALTLTLRSKARVGESLKIGNVTMAERGLIEHLATGDVSLDLNQVSGVGEVSCDRVNIYGRDGAVVIESPVAGMARLVRVNGMSRRVTVTAGRNVYPVSVTRGDIVIATFNGITAKLQF